jgi:hypothetical protein
LTASSGRPAAFSPSERLTSASSTTITSPAWVASRTAAASSASPGVGLAEGDEGVAQGGVGGGLLGDGTDLPGDGDGILGWPPDLREAVHHQQVLRERAEHPSPLGRRRGWHQPHRLLLLAQRGRVAEPAQVVRQLLVQQPGPLRLASLIH